LAYVAGHLERCDGFLVGDRFTIADAYLIWALLLIRAARVDLARWPALADYVEAIRKRPQVDAAVTLEWNLSKESRSP
jgi:glutathione S-transferase